MKIIIAGGRNYIISETHYNQIFRKLNYYKERGELSGLVSGACPSGADVLNDIFSQIFLHTEPEKFRANWTENGKAAGPIRNEQMAKYVGNKGGCILLPGGRGTANMKMNAEKYGLKIWELK